MFRLLGDGVFGDLEDLSRSRLAVLPGTSHTEWLASMITEFIDESC